MTGTVSTEPRILRIGRPLIAKGFRLTPIHPLTKVPVLKNWGDHQADTVEKLTEYSTMSGGKYADYNVGAVGKRGVGRHCFLDIDAKGVVERIESETGKKIPETYTVLSRPDSAKWKRHFYFTQTEYSFKQFATLGRSTDPWDSVNVNVKDLTSTDDEGKHPTLYDVKGIGGGSQVVAAGSIRDGGEVYRAIKPDAAVQPIPDWLVDWLVADILKYRAGHDAELKAKREVKMRSREKFPAAERAKLRQQNLADGFDIYPDDIYWFIRSRAGSFSRLGMTREEIEQCLKTQVVNFCHGGRDYIRTEKGLATIHKAANDSGLQFGDASFFYDVFQARAPKLDPLVLTAKPPKASPRRDCIAAVIEKLPPKIDGSDAYAKIERACSKAGHAFDRENDSDQTLVRRLRSKAGFVVTPLGDGRHAWERQTR